MFATALTFVIGASAAGWVMARLKVIAITAAAFALTNAASFGIGYFKGHNTAATACKVQTVTRERDEARRDLKIAKDTGDLLQQELAAREKRLANADQKVTDYAAELQRKNDELDAAERRAAAARPKSCPACPAARSCVVD
jgi:septal ring factor EnvC (AmiA/AmiB activator)